MEKLSKLRLPKSAVALNSPQMKATRGGYGSTGCHPAMCESGETCTSPRGYIGICRELDDTCTCDDGRGYGGGYHGCDYPRWGLCWRRVNVVDGGCIFTGDPTFFCDR